MPASTSLRRRSARIGRETSSALWNSSNRRVPMNAWRSTSRVQASPSCAIGRATLQGWLAKSAMRTAQPSISDLHSKYEPSYGAPMPKIDLTFSAGALSDDAKRELPKELAAAMLRWEGAPDTEFFRSITWTHVHELPAEAVFTADGQAEQSQFAVDATVPSGALSDRRKGGLVEEFSKLIRDAAGLTEA